MPRRHSAGDAVLQEDHVAQGHRGRLQVRQREGVSAGSQLVVVKHNVCSTCPLLHSDSCCACRPNVRSLSVHLDAARLAVHTSSSASSGCRGSSATCQSATDDTRSPDASDAALVPPPAG